MPRMEETRRITRLLDLIWRIDAHPGRWSRAALAQHYEVSERQITKDLQILRHGLCMALIHERGAYRFTAPPWPVVRTSAAHTAPQDRPAGPATPSPAYRGRRAAAAPPAAAPG